MLQSPANKGSNQVDLSKTGTRMSDDLFSAPDGQFVQDAGRPRGNPLGFSLEFREGIALVTLREHKLAQNLLIENLSLEVPEVKFPFDVSGGAEQFRHHRCRLRTFVISIGQNDLVGLLSGLLDPARYGITNIDIVLEQGHGLLCGKWQVGKDSAPFTARFVAEAGSELSVRLGMMDVRILGPMSLPASALVAQLGRALKQLRVDVSDNAYLTFHPVRDLIRWLLPTSGWGAATSSSRTSPKSYAKRSQSSCPNWSWPCAPYTWAY